MSITKNEDGTYDVVFGIAEGINAAGHVIRRSVVEQELKRINENPRPLISELGYPSELGYQPEYPQLSQMVVDARLMDLHVERACGYISDLRIEEGSPPMIVGCFTPAGIHGETAIRMIDQKHPVKFGMRSGVFPFTRSGGTVTELVGIVTWDLISEGEHGRA